MSDIAQLGIEVSMIGASQASDSLNKVADAGKRAEDSASSLTGVLHTLASAWAVRETAEMIYNLANIGAKYEMLGATLGVMGNNAGVTEARMRGIQNSLEETGISAIRARQSIQIMAAAQLELKYAADLGRVAQDGATLAGINSSEAFQKLVQGISTGESRIIRHMGIMVNFKHTINEYARANNVAVESLSEHTKMQERMRAVLEEGAKRYGVYEAAMTTAGKQMLSMQRYSENLKVQIGETFNPATNAIVFALVAGFKDASEAMKAWQESGEQAVFASTLKANIEGIISTVKFLGEVLYDARVPIEIFIGMFAVNKLYEWGAATLASTRAAANEIVMSEVRVSEAKLARARATVAATQTDLNEFQVRLAAANGRFIEQSSWDANTAAIKRHEVATKQLMAAKLELAAAERASTGASATFNGVLTALGGPIGIAIMGVTALIILYQNLKDVVEEEAAAATRAGKDKNEWFKVEIERLTKYIAARDSGKTKEQAIKDSELAAGAAEIKILTEKKDKLQEVQDKQREASIQLYRDQMALTVSAKELAKVVENYKKSQNELPDGAVLAAAKAELKTLTDRAQLFAQLKDKEEEWRLKDAANKKLDEEAAQNRERNLFYVRTMATMQEKINEASQKGMGYAKVELDIMKAKENAAKQRLIWEEMNREKDAKGVQKLGDQQLANLVERQKTEVEELIGAIIRLNDEALSKSMLSNYATLVRENYDYGKSLEEIIDLRYQDANSRKENGDSEVELLRLRNLEVDEYVTKMRRASDIGLIYAETVRVINQNVRLGIITSQQAREQRFKAADDASGGRLSNNETAIEKYYRSLDSLQNSHDRNYTNLVTYQRELIKLKESSGTAWAGAAAAVKGYTDQTSSLLADYFNGVAGNWHDMFSKMARDMEVAMIKAALMKPIMDGLAASISNLTKGGDLSFLQAFMAGSGWGNPTSTPNTSGGALFDAGGFMLPYLANGGPINGPAIVGEKGPELFIPKGSGSIIPNSALGGVQVVTNISVTVEEGQSKTAASGARGNAISDDLAGMMDAWAIKNFRPGGRFNPIRSN